MCYLQHKISPLAKIFSVLTIDALLLLFSYLYPFVIAPFPEGMTDCAFLRLTNLPCPTCGMTRAMGALLEFQILKSILFHPSVILFALFIFIFNVKVFYNSFKGKYGFSSDFSLKLILIPIFSIIVFFIIRLALLFLFKIDLIYVAKNL